MEITVKLQVGTTINAVLRDGKLAVTAAIAVPYGSTGRSATTPVDVTDPELLKELGAVLQKIHNKVIEPAVPRAQAAAHECLTIALNRKEKV